MGSLIKLTYGVSEMAQPVTTLKVFYHLFASLFTKDSMVHIATELWSGFPRDNY